MTKFLHNERYHGLTRDGDGSVRWNGHTWEAAYQCEPVAEAATTQNVRDGRMLLTCGHWVSIDHRFCPMCGRAIMGTYIPRKLAALMEGKRTANR